MTNDTTTTETADTEDAFFDSFEKAHANEIERVERQSPGDDWLDGNQHLNELPVFDSEGRCYRVTVERTPEYDADYDTGESTDSRTDSEQQFRTEVQR